MFCHVISVDKSVDSVNNWMNIFGYCVEITDLLQNVVVNYELFHSYPQITMLDKQEKIHSIPSWF